MNEKSKHNIYEIFLPFSLALIAALGPFSVDSYLPAIPTIAKAFDESVSHIQLTVSIYLLGLSLGQLVGGPLSDNLGRRKILIIGLSMYLVATFIMIFSDSFVSLVPLRLMQSFGGGFCAVIPASTVRDSFSGKDVAKKIAMIGFIMLSAPMFAPILGTLLLNAFGWHSIFVFMAIYGSSLLLYSALFFKETNKSRSAHSSILAVIGNYKSIIFERKSLLIIATLALSYGALFSFVTGGSVFYIDIWKQTPEQFSLYFAINIAALIALNRMNPIFLRYWESRILFAIGLAIQLVACLFLMLSLYFELHLYFIVASIAFVAGPIGLSSPNAMTCLLEDHVKNSGSAVAVMGASNFIFGALAGSFLSHIQSNSPWSLVGVMSGCSVAASSLFIFATYPALFNETKKAAAVA